MVKKGILLHNFAHFLLPFLIFHIFTRITPEINRFLAFIVIWAGSLLPDIDHINIWRKTYYKDFKEFLKYCLSSDRYRKTFLMFHNILTIIVLIIVMIMTSVLNIFISIFFLAIISHLILDLLTDKLLIKIHGHWKFRSWI